MKKIIFINGKAIEYELTVKKVKNINLRIHRNGSITVSASKRIPINVIEKFLVDRSDFITSALDRFSSEPIASFEYDDGDKMLLQGRSYTVKNEMSSRISAEARDDGTVVIRTPDNAPKSRQKAVLRLYERVCETAVIPVCEEVFSDLKHICPDMPDICFRKAKSRWGSCYSTRKKIILNKLLAAVPAECIRYVIYHEFIHLLHPDHSKNFYLSLSRCLPEHKALKKQLNTYSAILDFPSER